MKRFVCITKRCPLSSKSLINEVADTNAYSTKEMTNLIERLIHATKSNPNPKYTEFNQRFYKFPSYFRRAAIATAFGKVKSYRSLLENWETEKQVALENGRKFNKQPPTKQFTHKEFPVLYKGNMFKRTSDTTACVKAFVKNDWVWVDVVFRPQDLYKRGVHEWKECNPKLVKQGKKYFLNVSYEEQVALHKEKIQHQRICAVDLGLTNSAVCSILDANGTVLARKFIRHQREKDQLRRATNYLRKAQRQTGYCFYASLLEPDQRFTKTNLKRYSCSNHSIRQTASCAYHRFRVFRQNASTKGCLRCEKITF